MGVSIFTDNSEKSIRLLNSIESPIKIAGGPFAAQLPNELLTHCDYVFLGEAELSFPIFLNLIKFNGFDKGKIPSIIGVRSKSEKEGQQNTSSYKLANLDSVPLSGWLYVNKYFRMTEEASPMWHLKSEVVNILTSRGCNYNCIFCLSSKMHGNVPRFRSVENVEEEINLINELRRKQGISRLESIMLDDSDIFLRDNFSLEKLFLMLKKQGLTYSAFASINNADENLIALGKETGLKTLFFGIETNQVNRKRISPKKYFDDSTARYVLDMCRSKDIFTCTSFIIGFPWETQEDIFKTIECMDSLPSDYPGIGTLDLHPGTAIWRNESRYRRTYSDLCSCSDRISKNELDNFVKIAYKRAYSNPIRLNLLLSLTDSFDRKKALQTIERKRKIYS